MKRSKITILLAIVLGMTFHSCLDLEPQDQLGGKNMWTSVNDYKQFANTFYSGRVIFLLSYMMEHIVTNVRI